jgi:hypothetical protein
MHHDDARVTGPKFLGCALAKCDEPLSTIQNTRRADRERPWSITVPPRPAAKG